MTIYHFHCTLKAIQFRNGPTLRGLVDHEPIRKARAELKEKFPRAEEGRHALGHAAEMEASRSSMDFNSLKEDYLSDNIKVENATVMISGSRDGDRLISSWGNAHTGQSEVLQTSVNRQSLGHVQAIRDLVFLGFDQNPKKSEMEASKLQPYYHHYKG